MKLLISLKFYKNKSFQSSILFSLLLYVVYFVKITVYILYTFQKLFQNIVDHLYILSFIYFIFSTLTWRIFVMKS